ncbi:AhpC/TSA antioxidant enzyme-domain-containing protein [Pavlovales sp. CCMP2436]|nr:AhpC/TSA antioxidant enzyme-domain-containing protein [Pavlovales sp. CCMP2436]
MHITAFLTHFGDFNAWEYAQQLKAVDAELAAMGADLTVIGIGSPSAGRTFAELIDFPTERLYADPVGSCHKALGFSPGALPDLQLPAGAKLLAMLAGVDSPGTVEAVLKGYLGDVNASPGWVGLALEQGAQQGRFPTSLSPNAFDSVGTTGLRPFELATLRLQNMAGILKNWEALAPSDPALCIQQGGTLVYDWKGELIYRYADEGILLYTPVDEMLTAMKEAIAEGPFEVAISTSIAMKSTDSAYM